MNTQNTFKKAVKAESKLRLAIAGPSGSGKTYSSLAIASYLVPGGKIALMDTEHGSASKYADLFNFDVMQMDAPFHPDRFCEAIRDAKAAGYDVLILDSLTHAWNGAGGLLEIVDQIAARMRTSNTFSAWKDATPIQTRLVEAILSADMHVIATIRSKQDYVQEKDDKGKTVITKVGMQPQQRDGFEYEFDIFTEMDIQNRMIVTKSRCPALNSKVIVKPGKEVAGVLAQWLHGQAVASPTVTAPVATARPASVVAPISGNGHDTPAAADAEFNALGKAPLSMSAPGASNAELAGLPAADAPVPTNGKPGKKPAIKTHAWFELGEELAKKCTHYATAAGAFNGNHAVNALASINGDGKWDAITDENVMDAIEALRQRAAAMPAA